jgi:hypothetical protein
LTNWWKMTDEEKRKLTHFEARVRQLLMHCESLRKENDSLKSKLQASESELKANTDQLKATTTRYENLKLAKLLTNDEKDVKSAQQRVSRLVRDIDRCIALIHE